MKSLVNATQPLSANDADGSSPIRRFLDPVTRLPITYRSTPISSVGKSVTRIEWSLDDQATRICEYFSHTIPTEAEIQAFILDEARILLAAARARRDCLSRSTVRVLGPDPLANCQFSRWLVANAPHRFRLAGQRKPAQEGNPIVPVVVNSLPRPWVAKTDADEIRVFLAPTQDPHKVAREWPALSRTICDKLELACLRYVLRHSTGDGQ